MLITEAAVNAIITPVNISTPSATFESIFLAPSINGSIFCINSERSLAILGNTSEIFDKNPDITLPNISPRAFPIALKNCAPSAINHLTPFICAIAPRAKSKADKPVTNIAKFPIASKPASIGIPPISRITTAIAVIVADNAIAISSMYLMFNLLIM